MKICAKCKEEKARDAFHRNAAKAEGLQSYCKVCKKDLDKRYYLSDPKAHSKRTSNRRKSYHKKSRQFIWEYLEQNPCIDCGETNPVVLEFDHVRGEKMSEISKMVSAERPIDIIAEEIAKCEVRCRNCHVIRTAKEQGWYACIGRTPQ